MRLEFQIVDALAREVNAEAAAGLVNRLRRMGPAAGSDGAPRAATNADLMKNITPADEKAWYQAQGLNQADVDALRKSAVLSGMPNPSGTFLNNAMQYIASPYVSYATGSAWASASVGFAAAAIAPPMNAAQQSAVVTLCESIREHGGPVIVPDKKNINDKHFLPELSKDFQTHVGQFSALHDQLAATMGRLGISSMGHTDATLKSNLESLPAGDLKDLREQVEQLLNAEKRLHETQRDFMMTQGAHERQWMGNRWQAIPRTVRAPAASLTGLVSKTPVPTVLWPTAQAVTSLVMTASQHVAAGFDERAKQEYNNKLNLMYGDFFTAQGNEKLKSGQPLEAADIDPVKLRGFINTPAQSVVKHVSAELKKEIGALEKALPPAAAGGAESSADGGDRAALAALKEDAAKLKEGRLSELNPNGLAASLLIASDKSVLSEQLVRDIKAKYTMREFSAQTAQRTGQAFHLGVFGSAASSVIGKATSAASGGAREAPIAQTVGVAMVSGTMAAIGALNQHTAITVKNNRREGDVDIGLGQQVLRGIMGGANEWQSNRAGTKASKAMNEMLGTESIDQMLQFAKAVRQQFGQTPLPEVAIRIEEPSPAATQGAAHDPGASSSSDPKGKRPMEE